VEVELETEDGEYNWQVVEIAVEHQPLGNLWSWQEDHTRSRERLVCFCFRRPFAGRAANQKNVMSSSPRIATERWQLTYSQEGEPGKAKPVVAVVVGAVVGAVVGGVVGGVVGAAGGVIGGAVGAVCHPLTAHSVAGSFLESCILDVPFRIQK